MSQTNFYQLSAKHYAASTFLLGIDSVVMLEDMNDEWFWKQILTHYRPAKYHFVAGSRTSDNTSTTTGCEQCLKYIGFLTQRFFVCIDSDYRYLKDENTFAGNGIIQTYTYSWENHCFHTNRFNGPTIGFDFQYFLKELSSIIHKPFTFLLYQLHNNYTEFTPKQFKKCISQQYKKGDEKNNGITILNRINALLNDTLGNIPSYHTFDYEEWTDKLNPKGLNEENTYLFVRGHNLYNMLNSLGNKIYENTDLEFESNILLAPFSYYEYPEILKIGGDIDKLNQLESYQTI